MVWIIIGCILLILLIILFSPVRIIVEYLNGKPKLIVKYLFFKKNITERIKSKDRKKNKADKVEKPQKKRDEKKKSPKRKIIPEDFSGKLEFFKNLVSSGGKALRRITRHIKIKDIYINFIISDMDACQCALKFGKANIIVYNILSYTGSFIKLKKESINILCVYNKPDCIYDIKFKLYITPAAAIGTVIAFIFTFLVNNKKTKKSLKERQYCTKIAPKIRS